MNFVIKVMVLVLIAWPPVSGFAAMPCRAQSSQTLALADGMQTVPCAQTADRGGRTVPLSPVCHGGMCSLFCAGVAIPATAFLPFMPEFSTAYLSLADRRVSLFIPEQLQRPPLAA
jgi:hypothetical protein